jgi:glycine cleavage system H protein
LLNRRAESDERNLRTRRIAVVVVLVLLTITTLLIVDHFLRKASVETELSLVGGVGRDAFDLVGIPGGTYLAPGHTWLRPAADGPVLLGADRLPLHALGGVDHVQLVEPGTAVRAGQPIATLGRGQRLVRLYSPIDGVVEAVNQDARRQPDRLQADPYEAGWLYAIRPQGLAAALRRMFIAEEATAWMRREIGRLRDVISSLGAPRAEPVPALLDGGVPMDGFAEDLSHEQWVAVVETLFEIPPDAWRSS